MCHIMKLKNAAIIHHIMKPENAAIMHCTLKLEDTVDTTIKHCILKPENAIDATIMHHIMKLKRTASKHTVESRSGPNDLDTIVGSRQVPNHINPTRTDHEESTPTFMAPTPNWIFPSNNESSLSLALQQVNDTDLAWPFNSTTTHQQGYYTTLTTSPIDSDSTQSTYTMASEHASSDHKSHQKDSSSLQEGCIFTSLLERPALALPNAPVSLEVEAIATLGSTGWMNASDSYQPHQ
jgi:hypothetical protein